MSDVERESTSVPLWSSTSRVHLAGVVVASAGVFVLSVALGGSGAAATVGLVLAEAIALYVGYGAVTRIAIPAVRGVLASG